MPYFSDSAELYDLIGGLFGELARDDDLARKSRAINTTVQWSMDADTAHRFWLGKLSVTVALARGQMHAKGPVAKVLKLVPLLQPAFPIHRRRLMAAGCDDLARVA